MLRGFKFSLPSLLWLCVLTLAAVQPARANGGNQDLFVKATAGPYQLQVGVHPPATLPGAAEIDVRSDDVDVNVVSVSLATGPPQTLQRFSQEPIFSGSVWVGTGASWRAVIHIKGGRGEADTTVAVPAPSDTTTGIRRFNTPQWWALGTVALMCVALLLFRQSRTISIAGFVVLAILFTVAIVIASRKPNAATPEMQVSLQGSGRLQLTLPGKMDDLVEDHGYLMHFVAIRQPDMDVIMHLYPRQLSAGHFEVTLPSTAPGPFLLFADVVHRDGQVDVFKASVGLPVQVGNQLSGDDSVAVVPPLSHADVVSGPGTQTIRLTDGYSMSLDLPTTLHARSGQLLRFALLDPAGAPPADMQLYMGLQAHAVVVKTDGTVYGHIDSSSIDLSGVNTGAGATAPGPASGVTLAYGFPSAGRYRIFVQMKHGGIVETGVFDLLVR